MEKSKGRPRTFSPSNAKHFDTMLRRIRAGQWALVDPRDLKNLLMDLRSKFDVGHENARKRWERLAAAIGYASTEPGRPNKDSDWKERESVRRMLLDYYVERFEPSAEEEREWRRDLELVDRFPRRRPARDPGRSRPPRRGR